MYNFAPAAEDERGVEDTGQADTSTTDATGDCETTQSSDDEVPQYVLESVSDD